jgi:hypothetical protein
LVTKNTNFFTNFWISGEKNRASSFKVTITQEEAFERGEVRPKNSGYVRLLAG